MKRYISKTTSAMEVADSTLKIHNFLDADKVKKYIWCNCQHNKAKNNVIQFSGIF